MIDVPGVPSPPAPPVRPCDAPGCVGAAVLQWQRLATVAELAALALPPGVVDARIAVFGCTGHAMDLESAARVHQADCLWPSPCSCLGGPS